MSQEKIARKMIIQKLPGFKRYIALSFICALGLQLVALVPPLLMRNIIDTHIPQGNLQSTLGAIVLFVSIPLGAAIVSTFYDYGLSVSARNMGRALTMMGFERMIYQPVAYFDKNNSGEMAAYCKSEALSYVMFWLFDTPRLFASLLSGLVVYGLIFAQSPYIALGLLLYIPLSIVPSRWLAKMMQGNVKRITENNAKTNQLMANTFQGIKFVKTMLLEKVQLAKINDVNKSTVTAFSRAVAIEHLNRNWTGNFLDKLFVGVVFAVAAILVIQGRATLGMLVVMLGYLPLFFSAVRSVTDANFQFSRQLAQFDKFFGILAMEDSRDKDRQGTDFAFQDAILFKNVGFAYDQERGNVLKGLDLQIRKNNWVAIVGESGAGKTTVFDLLLKLYDGYSGDIIVDDQPLTAITSASLRRGMTKVSQELFLFPGTLGDNLRLAKPDATQAELTAALSLAGLDGFMAKQPHGLDTDIGEGGLLLSGGEKQRICLALGILRGSQILLLDEVTANLDPETEARVMDNIKALMDVRDLTVVSISHRVECLEYADYVVRI